MDQILLCNTSGFDEDHVNRWENIFCAGESMESDHVCQAFFATAFLPQFSMCYPVNRSKCSILRGNLAAKDDLKSLLFGATVCATKGEI
ncbi:MAG: hypothetical protein WCK00_02200 [Deltaproteobacteria bacterium]